jgi:hypothetical protein
MQDEQAEFINKFNSSPELEKKYAGHLFGKI